MPNRRYFITSSTVDALVTFLLDHNAGEDPTAERHAFVVVTLSDEKVTEFDNLVAEHKVVVQISPLEEKKEA